MVTYLEFCQPKVTNLDSKGVIYQHILTLDVSVYDAQTVHVLEGDGCISCYRQPLLNRDFHLSLLHMQRVEQGAW